jgi:hypothetical protein
MVAIFILCAIVQYNDPDALLWMVIYGLSALVCFLFLFGRLNWGYSALMALGTFGAVLYLAPQVIGKISFTEIFGSMYMENLTVEKAREMGGLIIIAVWMTILTIRLRRKIKNDKLV